VIEKQERRMRRSGDPVGSDIEWGLARTVSDHPVREPTKQEFAGHMDRRPRVVIPELPAQGDGPTKGRIDCQKRRSTCLEPSGLGW
jgi:hypothetical protein